MYDEYPNGQRHFPPIRNSGHDVPRTEFGSTWEYKLFHHRVWNLLRITNCLLLSQLTAGGLAFITFPHAFWTITKLPIIHHKHILDNH